jgi:hypothetical protein
MDNYFKMLNGINVNDKTEQKNGLTYLSWAWAWAEVKKKFPDANYTIYEDQNGTIYWTDGRTCWVKTGVTINGIEHIEYLPVMDFRNASIPLEKITSFDVNKAIQRSLTKAVARHGLGLYIYAGEDLPEGKTQDETKQESAEDKTVEIPKKNAFNARTAISLWSAENGLNAKEFNDLRNDLTKKNIVELVSYDDMTIDQFNALCLSIQQNYPERLRKQA